MKDLVSCFSEHAVRISDVACSGGANAAVVIGGGGFLAAAAAERVEQSAVTSVYRSRLSASRKDLLIHVTWSRSPDGTALSIAVHDTASRHRAGASSRHLHKKKGSGTFTAGSCVVGVFWDYAGARYGAGPEPASGFYVAVVADAEFVLLLGDMSRDYVERLHGGIPIAEFRMAGRRERFVGCGYLSTRARFGEAGAEHDVGVGLDGEVEAWVSVDGKKVVQLRRPRWNFRGSHTFFLEGGEPVDMTWDLYGWLFHGAAGAGEPSMSSCAVFTFQARTAASEARPWLDDAGNEDYDDEAVAAAHGQPRKLGVAGASSGFCLLIQGFKNCAKIS